MARQMSEAALAAKEIRQNLKKAGVNAKVKKRNDCVDIDLIDAAPAQQRIIKEKTDCYSSQGFDGMQDISYARNKDFNGPQCRFVFVRNELSDNLMQDFFSTVKNKYADLCDLPENYEEAKNKYLPNARDYAAAFVYRLLMDEKAEDSKNFWRSRKPIKKLS